MVRPGECHDGKSEPIIWLRYSRASCPSGQTALFTSAASCWFGTKTYCCPSPTDLTDCNWVTKTHSSGVDSDCANAVCNATQVEVLRSNGGDGENVRCACKSHRCWRVSCFLEAVHDILLTSYLGGRQQAACCSVQVAPVTPAFCSYNLCNNPGFCTNDGNPGIAQNKRDLVVIDSDSSEGLHTLEKRGQDHYVANLPNGINLVIIAIAVRAISELFRDTAANSGPVRPIRTQFRLRPGTCIGPAIDLIPIGPGTNPPGLTGDQTEHPLEVSVLMFPYYNGFLTWLRWATIFETLPRNYHQRTA